MSYDIVRYENCWRTPWNDLNAQARNGHFLFDRNFMEYHADRFDDCSYLILDDAKKAIGLFPADRKSDVLRSHDGLTFGGLVMADSVGAAECLRALRQLVAAVAGEGIETIVYKALPPIYHKRPAQEDLYALTRIGAELTRREITTAIDYRSPGPFSSRRKRGAKKAAAAGLTVEERPAWREFWAVLSEVLKERHEVAPVHTVEEMELLASRFPENIRLFVALKDREVVAGVVMFVTDTVAHAQYIASGGKGKEHGALDAIFQHVIQHYAATKRFFDFGISTESGGAELNEGLMRFKEEFGGTGVVHDQYTIRTSRARL